MKIRHLVAVAAVGGIALGACGQGGGYGRPETSRASEPAAATTVEVGTRDTALGPVLVDGKQLTLYGLTQDDGATSSCVGACAMVWPPETVDGAALPSGLDPAIFSVVARPDGTHQLKAGMWPLYRFAGDAAPGDVNGQGSGGVWYAVTPTGGLHKP